MNPPCKQMAEFLAKINRKPPAPEPQEEVPFIAEIREMKDYLDEGDVDKTKWPTSAIMSVRLLLIMTNPDFDKITNILNAKALFDQWKEESDRRYRAGFYASPLGEPVPRNSKSL